MVYMETYPPWANQEKSPLSAAGIEAVGRRSALPGGSNVTGGAMAEPVR